MVLQQQIYVSGVRIWIIVFLCKASVPLRMCRRSQPQYYIGMSLRDESQTFRKLLMENHTHFIRLLMQFCQTKLHCWIQKEMAFRVLTFQSGFHIVQYLLFCWGLVSHDNKGCVNIGCISQKGGWFLWCHWWEDKTGQFTLMWNSGIETFMMSFITPYLENDEFWFIEYWFFVSK